MSRIGLLFIYGRGLWTELKLEGVDMGAAGIEIEFNPYLKSRLKH